MSLEEDENDSKVTKNGCLYVARDALYFVFFVATWHFQLAFGV